MRFGPDLAFNRLPPCSYLDHAFLSVGFGQATPVHRPAIVRMDTDMVPYYVVLGDPVHLGRGDRAVRHVVRLDLACYQHKLVLHVDDLLKPRPEQIARSRRLMFLRPHRSLQCSHRITPG
jgi:hypothetical protein